jgi:hypothetical protein
MALSRPSRCLNEKGVLGSLSTMPPIFKWILQGFGIFAFIVCMTSLAIYAINFRSRLRAEALLRDVRALRVEQSTTEQVKQMMIRHGGSPSNSYASFCEPRDGAYDVWTGSVTIYRISQALPVLERLGLHPWGTAATVVLRNGRACFVTYGFGMMAPRGDWQWEIQTRLMPTRTIDASSTTLSGYKSGTRDFKGVRWLRSELTPAATEEERRRAFSYDFSCLTRFTGCRQRCEVAPLVWLDVYGDSLRSNWRMPAEETNDPRCKLLEQAH